MRADETVIGLRPTSTPTRWGRVHALVAGTPDRGDLVVVPGLGVSAYLRQSVALAAAAGYRAWLPDPPGFGDSGDPTRRLGIADVADVLVHWLRERELAPSALVGHSCGTQVAAHMAAQGVAERLLLGSPTVDPRYRSWPKALLRWRRDGQLEPRSLVRTQLPEWRRAGPIRLLRLARSMLADDLETTLRHVTCPVTVIRGERDPLCTREWAGALGDEFVEVTGLPHAFPYQRPSAWVDVLSGRCADER